MPTWLRLTVRDGHRRASGKSGTLLILGDRRNRAFLQIQAASAEMERNVIRQGICEGVKGAWVQRRPSPYHDPEKQRLRPEPDGRSDTLGVVAVAEDRIIANGFWHVELQLQLRRHGTDPGVPDGPANSGLRSHKKGRHE